MNIKQIRYFAAVVEHGSLSAAAKSQHVTVQAISKSMADLEAEVRCDLFVRNNQGMNPTSFAKKLYEQAVPVLERFQELEAFASRCRESGARLARLRLALNTPPFIGNEAVRENTAALVEGQAGVPTTMALATGEEGLEGLRAGEFDALVTVGTYTHPDVECRPVGAVHSAVFMCRDHPLASKEELTLDDLAPYPIALSAWFCDANDSISSTYRARRADLRFAKVELNEVVSHLKGDGVILTTGIPALEKTHAMAAVRPFAAQDSVNVPICIVCLKNHAAAVRATIGDLLEEGIPSLNFGKLVG